MSPGQILSEVKAHHYTKLNQDTCTTQVSLYPGCCSSRVWTSGRKRKAQPGRGRTRKNTRARETEQDGQEQAQTRETPPTSLQTDYQGFARFAQEAVPGVRVGGPPYLPGKDHKQTRLAGCFCRTLTPAPLPSPLDRAQPSLSFSDQGQWARNG